MKRQIRIWLTRIIILGACVFVWMKWGAPTYRQFITPKKEVAFVPTARVQSGKLVVSFHEMGKLDAEKSVTVAPETEGKIVKLAAEATAVKQGDTIAVLDTTKMQDDVRNKELNYRRELGNVTRAKSEFDLLKASNLNELEKAKADLEFVKTELSRAEKNYDKKKRLAAEKLVPGSEVEAAELEVQSKKLAVKKGEMDLALKEKDIKNKEAQKGGDVANAEFSAGMAKRDLDEMLKRIKSGVILAPAAGMVVISKFWDGTSVRSYSVGDDVHIGRPIATLPDLNSMLIKNKIGESDAPKVKAGQQVVFKLEARPDKTFHGQVKEISTLAREGDPWDGGTPGRKNFDVTIKVKESNPAILKPGMSADVEFIEEVIKNAAYAPIEAVFEKNGKTYAWVKKGGKWEQAIVSTGKRNDNFVIIKKGLKPGMEIALRDPSRPSDDSASDASANSDKPSAAPIPENNGKKK